MVKVRGTGLRFFPPHPRVKVTRSVSSHLDHKQTDWQTDRQAGRQTDRHSHTQTYAHKHIHTQTQAHTHTYTHMHTHEHKRT